MKVFLIVDGYSGGIFLAPELKKRGHRVLHLQSDAGIWEKLLPKFDFSPYESHFVFTGDKAAVLEWLKNYTVLAVIPGTETGVELADQLATSLGVFANGIELSAARRDKFLMVEACRKHGLHVASQIKSSNSQEILGWYRGSGLTRVVVKPHKSAGTEDVFLCQSDNEILSALATILSKKNILGLANTEAVVQEYLVGNEYFVDTVSLEGQVRFTDIWKYQKRSINGKDFVYDKNILCDPRDARVRELMEYTKKVLNALGIQYGPAHTELIYTESGPALVEVGARVDGLTLPAVNEASIGYGPIEATVDCYCDPDKFLNRPEIYPLQKNARTVYLTSYQEGKLLSFPGKTKLESLPSFFQLSMRVQSGGDMKKTTNYFTAPGFLTLIHEDEGVVERDYDSIRKTEVSPGFYELQT